MAIDKKAFLCRIGKEKADQDRAIENAGRSKDCHGMFLEEKNKERNGNKEDEKKKSRKGIESVMFPYQKPSVHRKEEGKDFLIEKGYDEKYGARPLRRAIQSMLEDQLAEKILDGTVKEGEEVEVGRSEDGLTFQPKTLQKQ